jgi:hypothetical protein
MAPIPALDLSHWRGRARRHGCTRHRSGRTCGWQPAGLVRTQCIPSGTRGIVFTASGNSSGGNIQYVQLVNNGSVSGGSNCTIAPGLDTNYPCNIFVTGTNNQTDSPAVALESTYTTLSRTEDFTMYLMWQSTQQGMTTIWVPVGNQTWGFSGSANCRSSCGSAANWSASTTRAVTANGFTASALYPQWNGMVACQ